MPKHTFTITADIPEGYEPTGEYRFVTNGENFICQDGRVGHAVAFNHEFIGPRLILRKAWEAPKCFPDGAWVYACGDSWYINRNEPRRSINSHSLRLDYVQGHPEIDAHHYAEIGGETFTPPPVRKIQIKRG